MKIKRLEVTTLFNAIAQVNEEHPKGVEYSFVKDYSILKKEVVSLQEDLDALRTQFADKTEDGKPIRSNEGVFSFKKLSDSERADLTEQIKQVMEEVIDLPLKIVKRDQLKNFNELNLNALADLLGTIIGDEDGPEAAS